MSVPAWKKAIIERRKKAEDEEKKKQAEEEAKLATLPPWKRALFQKRERERLQQLEKEKAAAGSGDGGDACQRSNSFQKRQQQVAQQERGKTAKGWGGGQRVTPPSSSSERRPTSPTSPPHNSSHQFFPAASSSSTSNRATPQWANRRRGSVTTLPGVDEPIAAKVASAPAPQPATGVVQSGFRPRASSESSAIAGNKVVSNVKKLTGSQQQLSSEMPAWKKALLERRREKERAAGGDISSTSAAGQSLLLARKESPPQDSGNIREDSALAMKRKPSPVDRVLTEPAPLSLQRKASPVEQKTQPSQRGSGENFGVERSQFGRTDPNKSGPKSPSFARKTSPVESGGAKMTQKTPRSGSPIETTSRGPETSSVRKSAAPTSDVSEPKRKESKPVPSRMAPVAPTTTGRRNDPQQKPLSSYKPQASLSRAQQQRPTPEVVNRRGSSEAPPHQSHVIQAEGVTHRAPIYKEVSEWANVSEEDEKFRSLPTWKQALIRRRRADIAKRMGHTTSVDDVPLANGPVPSNDKQGDNPQGVQSRDGPASIPPWKKQMMQRKAEGGLTGPNLMSAHEKKQLSTRRESPTNTTSNVKTLLGRFSDRSSPSPPPPPASTTVPKVTVTEARTPSPSSPSPPPLPGPTSSSRPPPSSVGVPPATGSGHTTRKTFTWTPGEDTMPGEALSDDSSGEDEDDEEGGAGEYTVTNLDDTSEEEEEEEEEDEGSGDGESSGVVLLRPLQTLVSSSTTDIPSAATSGGDGTQKVRKTSSILVVSGRQKKRVSSCDYLLMIRVSRDGYGTMVSLAVVWCRL